MELPANIKIVHVEDDPATVRLTELTLRGGGVGNEIVVKNTGAEAINFFTAITAPPEDSRIPPILVLLDLNLPGVQGHEVLAFLKAREATRHFPVFVVSSSADPDDERRCLALGAERFMAKPLDIQEFEWAVAALGLDPGAAVGAGAAAHGAAAGTFV